MPRPRPVRLATLVAMTLFAVVGCSEAPAPVVPPPPDGGSVAEKRCGESPDKYFSAYTLEQLAAFSDCTVLVGHFQEDSVSELKDLAPLKNVRRVEGHVNLFRSPGFLTLHGLENLEEVQGNLSIHLNENLMSIEALGKLHKVTGSLHINGNNRLPQAQVEALGARVTVGGSKSLGTPSTAP